MQYFIYAGGTHLIVCHMMILHYQFLHRINVFWPNNRFWKIFKKFVGEGIAATIKLAILAFHSGIGWGLIAKVEIS